MGDLRGSSARGLREKLWLHHARRQKTQRFMQYKKFHRTWECTDWNVSGWHKILLNSMMVWYIFWRKKTLYCTVLSVLYCTQCTVHNSEQSWAVAKTVASKSKGKICIACCPVAIHMYCKQWGNKVFGAKCLKCLVFCTVTEALTYCHVVARLSVTRPAQLLGWRLNHDALSQDKHELNGKYQLLGL